MAKRMENAGKVLVSLDGEMVRMSPEDYVGRFRLLRDAVDEVLRVLDQLPVARQGDDEPAGYTDYENAAEVALTNAMNRAHKHARTMYGLALARAADAGGGWVDK